STCASLPAMRLWLMDSRSFAQVWCLIEQVALGPGRPKRGRIELAHIARGGIIEPEPLARLGKALGDKLGEHSLTTHAFAKAAVVMVATATLAHQAHHLAGPLGVVGL